MAKIILFYRDAHNHKCTWETQVPDEVIMSLPESDNDTMYDINLLGLSVYDIPLIKDFGYDEDADHPFVTIEKCEFDQAKNRA